MRRSFTTTEVAGMLGLDKTTIGKWIDTGKLKGFKTPGGHRRVFPEDVASYFQAINVAIPANVQECLAPVAHP